MIARAEVSFKLYLFQLFAFDRIIQQRELIVLVRILENMQLVWFGLKASLIAARENLRVSEFSLRNRK